MAQAQVANYLQGISSRIDKVVKQRNWTKDWSSGGCYIHLEVSEFIESLRGKGSDPAAEAGDVIIALFAVLGHYQIPISDVMGNLTRTLSKLEEGSLGIWDND